MNLAINTIFPSKNCIDRLAFMVVLECALCEAGLVGVERVKLVSYGF
jgi:hypothetical protein